MELQQQQSRELEMLRSTTRKSPKVRPYTPREAVEFLGREMRYTEYPQGKYKLIEVGLTHALIAGDYGYETYKSIAEHYTWADTGEPCGVVEK